MLFGRSAVSWFASCAFVLAVLRQGIQALGTRVALAVYHPGRVSFYPCFVANRGLPRPRARGGALYIGNAALGAAEKFLLLGTMRTPGSAIEFGVGAGEMFRQAAYQRISGPSRFSQIPRIVKMKRDDNDEGGAHRFAEPRTPGETWQASGLLQKQGDKNRQHQPKRSQAIGAGGLQLEKRDAGKV